MRDDFPLPVKEFLAKRVGHRCSNPDCRQPTSGPQKDPKKTINVGVAAHITAASPDGPRYNSSLTLEERKEGSNGIWLCQKCAKLVDNDPARYTVEKLLEWKKTAEDTAIRELEGASVNQQLEKTNAIAILKEINDLGNKIAIEPEIYGVPSVIDPSYIAQKINISFDEVQFLIDRFNDQGFLLYNWDDLLCGVTSKGRAYLYEKGLLSGSHINNPDYFPELNEAALKKHIALTSSHCPFEKAIKQVYLFEGTPFRYQLVVIGKDTKDFHGLKNYWDRSPSEIFEKHFKEVYHQDPEFNFWLDWNILVVESLQQIPDDLALKKYKWVLY